MSGVDAPILWPLLVYHNFQEFITDITFNFTENSLDYEGVTVLLNFGSCETRVCISVTIVNDSTAEGIEHFSASLERTANLDPRITIDPDFAKVEITDDYTGMQ